MLSLFDVKIYLVSPFALSMPDQVKRRERRRWEGRGREEEGEEREKGEERRR
jgi:hypothetical protein